MNSNFKVKSNDNHFIFSHKDGHFFKVAKKGISKELLDNVEKYAKGGMIKAADGVEIPKETATTKNSPFIYNDETPKTPWGDIGDALKSAGETLAPIFTQPLQSTPNTSQAQAPVPTRAGSVPGLGVDTSLTPGNVSGMTSGPSNIPLGNNTPASDQLPMVDYAGQLKQLQGAIGEQKAGLRDEAKIAQQKGPELEAVAQNEMDYRRQQLDDAQTEFASIAQDHKALMDDYASGKIDPNAAWDNKSVPKKIASILGIIIGGAGGSTKPIEMLQEEIKRDVAAQEAMLGKKKTLLDMNMQRYRNKSLAIQATELQLTGMVQAQLQQIGSKYMGPEAKAKLMKGIGELDERTFPMMSALATQAAIFKRLGQQQSTMQPTPELINYMVPEKERAEATKQYGEAMKTMDAHEAIDTMSTKLSHEQSLTNRLLNPIQSRRRIAALSAELIPQIMEANPSKRLTHESLTAEIDPLILGFMDNKQTAAQLKEGLHRLLDTHAAKPAALLQHRVPYPKYVPRTDANSAPGYERK